MNPFFKGFFFTKSVDEKRNMRIIAAPDSFKGSLTSVQAAEAIELGLKEVFPEAEVIKVPIADGGEGTVNAIVSMTGGQLLKTQVEGPLGEKVTALFGRCKNAEGEFAVIEMAEASGLLLEKEEDRDVLRASTYGTGQLIKAALDLGIRKIVIGIGGSATNDGGAGMAQALGAGLFDRNGQPVARGGAALATLERIDLSTLDKRLAETEIMIACDVKNPLCGPEGASAVYGPQKGATDEQVRILDEALRHYSDIAKRDTHRDVAENPGAGAAGGLGAGLMIFTSGRMCNGIELVLKMIGFDDLVKSADLVFTGEGFTDSQTANGKAPVGVAKIAKKYSIPVVCLSGGISLDANELLNHGIDAVNGTPCAPISLADCIADASSLLKAAAERCARLIKIGRALK